MEMVAVPYAIIFNSFVVKLETLSGSRMGVKPAMKASNGFLAEAIMRSNILFLSSSKY